MSAADLLRELARLGIEVEAADDRRLHLTGPSDVALTPELRRAIDAHRADLVAILTRPRSPDLESTPDPARALPRWLVGALGISAIALVVIGSVLRETSRAPEPPPAMPPGLWPGRDDWWGWDG